MDFLTRHQGESFAIDDIYDALKQEEEKVGRTTVYRTLEKLCSEQRCTKIEARAGKPAQYIYSIEDICEADRSSNGIKLYCMNCDKLLELECSHFKDFEEHVLRNHGFSLITGRSFIYGTCESCVDAQNS